VTESAHPLDLQLRTSHELWHKENLLNRVIQTFPPDWKYGAYCDGDFHFTRHDWALEAIHQLQHYDFVQLFSTYTDMGPHHLPERTHFGFAYAQAHRVDDRGSLLALETSPSSGYGRAGSPGGCWAFRRSAFESVGGLLDICILGSADHHMAVGLAGRNIPHPDTLHGASAYRLAIRAWQERALTLRGNIGYVDGHAIHHYHGPKQSRGYGWRPRVLRDHHFDPGRDLWRDAQGIYQLTPEKPRLRDEIRAYFRSRNEDAS
jgi:prepilin-type processing-associated H-X9-DG protein